VAVNVLNMHGRTVKNEIISTNTFSNGFNASMVKTKNK